MSDQRKINRAFDKRLEGFKEIPASMFGVIGNLNTGVVSVPNRTGKIYVTVLPKGEVLEVVNRKFPNNYQTPVQIGFDPDDFPNTLQVLTAWDVFDQSLENPSYGQAYHHEQHEWPHGDTTYVFGEQFLPSCYFPIASSLSVQIYPGNYYTTTGWQVIPTITTIDLTASVPTGADEARLSMIVVDAAGAFAVRNGVVRVGVSDTGWNELTDVDIPVPLAGDNPICAVKMYTGQTEFRKNGNNNDFIDLRFSGVSTGSIVGGGLGLDPIDCTAQIVSGGETHFTFTPAASVALVLLNGTIQKPTDVTLDTDGLGVTLAFGVELGDNLIIIRGANAGTIVLPGDVLGPSSSTNDHIAVFDLATGKVIKDGGHTIAEMSAIHSQIIFTVESVVTTGDKPIRIYVPYCGTGATIEEVFVAVNTAPTTSALRVTVKINDVSILTGGAPYIELPVGDFTVTKTAGFAYTALAKDDKVTIEVIQDDVAAANLSVHVRYTWSL